MADLSDRTWSFKPGILIASVSAAIICLEVLLTRVLSAILYYHFTFLVVSFGMLGFSAAALNVALADAVADSSLVDKKIISSAISFSLSIFISLILISAASSYGDAGSFFVLIAYCLSSILPFYYGGKAIALLLTHSRQHFARLYSIDFVAAALGCLLAIPLLTYLGGTLAVMAVSILSLLGFAVALDGRAKKIAYSLSALLVLISAGMSKSGNIFLSNPRMADKPLLYETWNPISRVSIYESLVSPWIQERTFGNPTYSNRLLVIDALATTSIIPKEARNDTLQIERDLSAAPYSVTGRRRALIIGAGGGRDILIALHHRFQRIDAVEINPDIVRLMRSGEFERFSGGVYNEERVNVSVSDGRRFMAESREIYDNIQLTLVDTFAATAAGAFALSENNLYTVEAVGAYMDHLASDGVLAIIRWAGPESVRLFHILREAALQRGVADIGKHVAVLASKLTPGTAPQAALVMYRKKPFDEESLRALRQFSGKAQLPLFHDPGKASSTRISQIVLAADPLAEAMRTDFYEQRPSTDDWPFFFFRPTKSYWLDALKSPEKLFSVPEYTVLGVSLIALAICFMALVFPILRSRAIRGNAGGSYKELPYFFAIGIGFMFVELPWIQRSVLYLGHPTIALTTVLFSLLVGCGAGALFVYRSGARLFFNGIQGSLAVVVLLMALELLHGILFESTAHAGQLVRCAIVACLFLPLGAVLGSLLPIGMSGIRERGNAVTAWAWAVNGCASVLGSCAAMLTALFWGFTATMYLGMSCYALAALAFYFGFSVPKERAMLRSLP